MQMMAHACSGERRMTAIVSYRDIVPCFPHFAVQCGAAGLISQGRVACTRFDALLLRRLRGFDNRLLRVWAAL